MSRARHPGNLAPAVLTLALFGGGSARGDAEREGVIATEFLFEQAPVPSCHASTIAETPAGLVAAWFGGTREGDNDVGIWLARRGVDRWTPPVEVATGRQDDGVRYPCWNPVLFQARNGPLLLFYKVGPKPNAWWGMLITSTDEGRTWSRPARLPEGILGPIKNKPVALADGALLCPSSTEDQGWRVHLERTADLGRTWTRVGPLNDGKTFAAIQPSVLFHPQGTLQIVCRSRQGKIVEAWSSDGGGTWGPLQATPLPNPNSGIDAATLADGRAILIYNHTPKGRSPLNVALSDDGKTWKAGPVLESEPGEYSYPAVIQAADGRVHVTYTWKRQRIKHVVLDAARLSGREMP
jgi:predicted neuraminidase